MVSTTRRMSCFTEVSRSGVFGLPWKYFEATMLVAVCDQDLGTSTFSWRKITCPFSLPIWAVRGSHSTASNPPAAGTFPLVKKRRNSSPALLRAPFFTSVCPFNTALWSAMVCLLWQVPGARGNLSILTLLRAGRRCCLVRHLIRGRGQKKGETPRLPRLVRLWRTPQRNRCHPRSGETCPEAGLGFPSFVSFSTGRIRDPATGAARQMTGIVAPESGRSVYGVWKTCQGENAIFMVAGDENVYL